MRNFIFVLSRSLRSRRKGLMMSLLTTATRTSSGGEIRRKRGRTMGKTISFSSRRCRCFASSSSREAPAVTPSYRNTETTSPDAAASKFARPCRDCLRAAAARAESAEPAASGTQHCSPHTASRQGGLSLPTPALSAPAPPLPLSKPLAHARRRGRAKSRAAAASRENPSRVRGESG